VSGLGTPTVPSWFDIGLMILQKFTPRRRDRYVVRRHDLWEPKS
jgi:hypothetical protein